MMEEYAELKARLRCLSDQTFVDVSAARVVMQQAANALDRLEHRILVMTLDRKTKNND